HRFQFVDFAAGPLRRSAEVAAARLYLRDQVNCRMAAFPLAGADVMIKLMVLEDFAAEPGLRIGFSDIPWGVGIPVAGREDIDAYRPRQPGHHRLNLVPE